MCPVCGAIKDLIAPLTKEEIQKYYTSPMTPDEEVKEGEVKEDKGDVEKEEKREEKEEEKEKESEEEEEKEEEEEEKKKEKEEDTSDEDMELEVDKDHIVGVRSAIHS